MHIDRELKIECILWLTASKGIKMGSAGTLHVLKQVRHNDKCLHTVTWLTLNLTSECTLYTLSVHIKRHTY